MQIVYRFDVESDDMVDFVTWIEETADARDEHAPDGWTYAGTYVTVHGLGAADVEVRWNLDDYGSLGSNVDETFADLVRANTRFAIDGSLRASLMRPADEVTIIG